MENRDQNQESQYIFGKKDIIESLLNLKVNITPICH